MTEKKKNTNAWDDRGGWAEFRYPETKQFTPTVATWKKEKKKKEKVSKNSISWNGPWNMSAVAEGALAALSLVVWASERCVVRCTPWVACVGGGGGRNPDSKALAGMARLSAPGKGRKTDPLIASGLCCHRAADCKWPLLNVTKGAICIQLPRWHRGGKTHVWTAYGQMCPQPACVSDGINVYLQMPEYKVITIYPPLYICILQLQLE